MPEKRPRRIAVVGGGSAPPTVLEQAEALGRAIAEAGWVLVNGGRAAGVMEASARGAAAAGGVTVGILPTADPSRGGVSEHVRVPVFTGMGDARNTVVALTGEVVVALPGGAGTLSEVALALKNRRPVVLLGWEHTEAVEAIGGDRVHLVETVEEAVGQVVALLEA